MSNYSIFRCKHFVLHQSDEVFKIGTDAMVLGAWIDLDQPPKRVLDIGTGTGILSLMLAQKFPNSKFLAIDANQFAVELANLNFEANSIGKNCIAVQGAFEDFHSDQLFDLIVSNPPYFLKSLTSKSQVNINARHLKEHELNAFFKTISKQLLPSGYAAIIHPLDSRFESAANSHGLYATKTLHVYGVQGKLVRVCRLYGLTQFIHQIEELVIRESSGSYTNSYKKLTSDFHGVSL